MAKVLKGREGRVKLIGPMGQTEPVIPVNIAAIEAFRGTLADSRMQYDPEAIMTPGSGFEVKIRLQPYFKQNPSWR